MWLTDTQLERHDKLLSEQRAADLLQGLLGRLEETSQYIGLNILLRGQKHTSHSPLALSIFQSQSLSTPVSWCESSASKRPAIQLLSEENSMCAAEPVPLVAIFLGSVLRIG